MLGHTVRSNWADFLFAAWDAAAAQPGRHADASRRLRCELLEARQMLSVSGDLSPLLQPVGEPEGQLAAVVVSPFADGSLAARDQQLAISAIHLLVGGREVTVSSLDDVVQMDVGESLEVVGIDFREQGESANGTIAFEGYLNRLHGSRLRTDYGDGRFSVRGSEGLNGAWTMEAGVESLTLVMVRYSENEVAVEDRVTIRTQVGTPDFVISPDITIKGSSQGLVVGKRVNIYGSWGNIGAGHYRNYAEVDIYHESNPDKPVWVGTLADDVEAGEFDDGEFRNKTRRDGFARRWIPDLGGTYTLKFYADPEQHWTESDESNNVVTIEIEVEDLRHRDRGIDAVLGRGANRHEVVEPIAPSLRDAALALATNDMTATPEASDIANDRQPVFDDVTAPLTSTPSPAPIAAGRPTDPARAGREATPSFDAEWTVAIDSALASPLA